MRIARLNNIYFYFLLSQFLFLPVNFISISAIPEMINTDKALVMHLIGLFWSAVGYFTAKYAYQLNNVKPSADEVEDESLYFSESFYLFSYLLIVFGTAVSAMQVFWFIPPGEYIARLFSYDFDIGIRDAFLTRWDDGGLPGIVKMFGFAPLTMYLMSLGLMTFTELRQDDEKRLKRLSVVALAAVVIKILFSLDRITIMAVLLANVYIGLKKGYLKNILYWIFLAGCIWLANFLSLKRLENFGVFDFAKLYFKLGLVNFQLMVDTCTEHTLGFSTILGPLYFILKFFNLPLPVFSHDYEWVWNPAQYFSSYAFLDFGYFYFLLFYFIGLMLFILNLGIAKKNVYVSAVYFVVLYGVVSFIAVPVIQGLEFWLALFLPMLLLNRFCTWNNHYLKNLN